MKKVISPMLFIAFLFLINGCTNRTKPKPKYDGTKPVRTVIAGKVIDPPEDGTTMMFIVSDLATARQLTYYTDIDMKDSTFHFSIERYLPQDIMIKYYNLFSVFVHPGDSLFITINGNILNDKFNNYEALQFSGEPSMFNVLFAKYYDLTNKNRLEHYRRLTDIWKKSSIEENIEFQDSIRKENYQVLWEIDSLYNAPEEFKSFIKTKIEVNYLCELIDYPFHYARYNKLEREDVAPLSYYDTLTMDLSQDMLINTDIRSYVNRYTISITNPKMWKYLIERKLAKDTIIKNKHRKIPFVKIDSAFVAFIVESTKAPLLRQLSLCEIAGQKLEGMNYRFFEDNKDIFDKYVTKPYLREPLLAYYNEVKYKCLKPEIASQAVINDLKNTSAEKIYNRILTDNKGKVIYLDCWETTCSPCRAEMPYSKKLMAKFDTSYVAFVYICFNSKKDTWKALLDEWQLGGQHYFADRNQSKYLSKAFSISGFPHYMLIDTKGNIVETELRPSFDETYSKIKGLIAKQ